MAKSLAQRFEKSVDRSGDHQLWTGAINPERGTGRLKVAEKQVTAHRVAWELEHGPLPADARVLHGDSGPGPCDFGPSDLTGEWSTVTDRKETMGLEAVNDPEAEGVLQDLARQLAPVFESVPGGVYLYLDPAHKVCNQRLAELLGTTVEEWRSLDNFRDTFVDVGDRQSYCDTYERVVHGLDWPDTYRFRAVRKDGTSFDAEATIVPLTFGGRKLAYHFVRVLPAREEPAPGATDVVRSFQDAWNAHDVDRAMALMTEDCVFESTWPPPDGERIVGQGDMRVFWERFFEESPRALIEIEELVGCGDRATMRWRYQWGSGSPPHDHVRGVDVYRVRGDKIAEKLSYVKG